MTLNPVMSEKAYASSKDLRTYVFSVPDSANKLSVAEAVKAQFKVGVDKVKVANIKGKSKRTVRQGRPVYGQRVTVKKAYVTLKEGDSLPFFAEVEKDQEKAEKTEEKAKAEPENTEKSTAKVIEAPAKKKRGLSGVFNRSSRQTQNRGGEK